MKGFIEVIGFCFAMAIVFSLTIWAIVWMIFVVKDYLPWPIFSG